MKKLIARVLLAALASLLLAARPAQAQYTYDLVRFTTVVAACTNLASPVWAPLTTNTLVNGSFCFSDPEWTNHTARYYRLQMP